MSTEFSRIDSSVRRILYVQYTNPIVYPPLTHSSRLLAKAGWHVLFLGTEGQGTGALRFSPHELITVRQRPFCPEGWRQKLHYTMFAVWVFASTLRWRPQWVYASDYLICPVALLVSYLPGTKVVYHEHDTPLSVPASAFSRFCLWARRRLAERAHICVLPNEQRAARFREATDRRLVLSVWNCPMRDEVEPPRGAPTNGDFWILYHGSIVPARLPPTVLKALIMLPDNVKLRVIGYETLGHTGYVRHLKEMAQRLGLDGRVEFLGAKNRDELLNWSGRCDVGLALFPLNSNDFNEQTMPGASNKAFEYLACGLALLVPDLPDWRKMYVEPGYGMVCNPDKPESIAAVVHWFLEHPVEMRAMGEQGRQRIAAEWNYEAQFEPVLEQINRKVS